MSLFELREVKKKFGNTIVLDNLNLAINEGELFGIIGANGSGKTTLLKLLIGYYKPDRGAVFYRGKNIYKSGKGLRREIGFTTQESSFYPKLTVEENIIYFASLYGLSKKETRVHTERVLALLELLPTRHHLAETLSGGMQRRLEMACSLVHDPKVLILDEPTEDLDPALRRNILSFIKKVNALGTTIIITSHLLGDLEKVCTKIAILHQKRIAYAGSPQKLTALGGGREEIHLQTEHGDYATLIRELELKEFYLDGSSIVIYTSQADELLNSIMTLLRNEGDKLVYLDIRKPRLQDIFEKITDPTWL